MSYTLIIKDTLEIHKDVVEIAQHLNERSSGLGSDFVVAFDDTLARLEQRLASDVEVRFAPKFEDIYGEPIEAERDSPVSAKKFRNYLVYYLLNEERKEAAVLAVAYGPRDPEYLSNLLQRRK